MFLSALFSSTTAYGKKKINDASRLRIVGNFSHVNTPVAGGGLAVLVAAVSPACCEVWA